jgi:hypothetical protein
MTLGTGLAPYARRVQPAASSSNTSVSVGKPPDLGLGISSPLLPDHAGLGVSERQRVLEYEIQRHGEHEIHEPESRKGAGKGTGAR